jgi:outer membrane protein assembly factor BamD
MFRKALLIALLSPALLLVTGCHHNKVDNPIAHVDSKQPDKVLFDRGMDAIKHGKYDVGRLTLQTLLNTYPDSEFVARAKLAIADSWYAEGGATGYAQAEIEYKDFETFFPNMKEAAEAQLKVANIHYKQMEKPDRDYTHAKRAEDEYKELLQMYPDADPKIVGEAKQRLLEVQEVLAEREYRIGRFYYLAESWPAAQARLKSLVDTYPLYSNADDALYMLGSSYEKQIEAIRATKTKYPEPNRAAAIKMLADDAAAAYSRIIERYPVMDRANDAKERLKALGRPIPTPTPEAIAQNKKEEESRRSTGVFGKMLGNLSSHPDVAKATKVGEPTLVEPPQTGAPEIERYDAMVLATGKIPTTATPNDNTEAKATGTTTATTNDANTLTPTTPDTNNGNDLSLMPNTQVNEINNPNTTSSSNTTNSNTNSTTNSNTTNTTANPQNSTQTASADKKDKKDDNSDNESSSKKKKKHGLRKIIPF